MIDYPSGKTNDQSRFLCAGICGRMFLPSSQKENDEVSSILRRNGVIKSAWIRISDVDNKGIWRDIENNASVIFTNWASGHPNTSLFQDPRELANINPNSEWYSMLSFTRDYRNDKHSTKLNSIICELP